jgi:hypothetical protein
MVKQLKGYFENFRFLSVFFLVVSFLVLGSCPMKKSLQVLLNDSAQTEHSGPGHGKSLASVLCVGGESSFSKKLALPERPIDANAPLFTALIITAFWYSFKSDSREVFLGESNSSSYQPVPLYLRNRTFLI